MPRTKPDGGYCSISAMTLGLLWWSYSTGRLSLRAVRVGLALQELQAPPGGLRLDRAEAGQGGPSSPRTTPSRSWPPSAASPRSGPGPPSPSCTPWATSSSSPPSESSWAPSLEALALPAEALAEFRSWIGTPHQTQAGPHPAADPGPRLRVAAPGPHRHHPRRLPPLLAGTSPEGFSFTGRLSCTWLASRFGLSLRAVQSAKEHLVGLGWIQRTGDITRFGERLVINPEWDRIAATNEAENPGPKRAGGDHPEIGRWDKFCGGRPRLPGQILRGSLLQENLFLRKKLKTNENLGRRARPEPGPGVFNSNRKAENPKTHLPRNSPRRGSRASGPRISGRRPGPGAPPPGRQMPAHAGRPRAFAAPLDDGRREGPDRPGRKNPAGLFLYLVKNRAMELPQPGARGGRPGAAESISSAERTTPPLLVPEHAGQGHPAGNSSPASSLERCRPVAIHPESGHPEPGAGLSVAVRRAGTGRGSSRRSGRWPSWAKSVPGWGGVEIMAIIGAVVQRSSARPDLLRLA